MAQRLGILPLRIEGGTLIVATADPFQLPAFDDIAARAQMPVREGLARPSAVRAHLRTARPEEELLSDVLRHADGGAAGIVFAPEAEADAGPGLAAADLAAEVNESDSPVVRFLNLVLTDAIRQRASDVHIECEKDALRVRIRVDGDLREIQRVSPRVRTSVLSRLKIVAGLDIMETRRPQDGRAHVIVEGRNYDLRVSTLPSYFGEKAVIRILDPSAPVFELAKSGIEAEELGAWRELLRRPNGLILMTGPTGSGKTSTLYASLLEIRDPTLNLVTVEDPVEYQFPGIVHVPMRAEIGFTFATALRSILRQDPDVILVGEIRDAETAEVAVQAALTGHLVLSTLHTNDANGRAPPPGEPRRRARHARELGARDHGAAARPHRLPALRRAPRVARRHPRAARRAEERGHVPDAPRRGSAAGAAGLRAARPHRRSSRGSCGQIAGAAGVDPRGRPGRRGPRPGRQGRHGGLSAAGLAKVLDGTTVRREVLAVAGPRPRDLPGARRGGGRAGRDEGPPVPHLRLTSKARLAACAPTAGAR